MPGYVTAQVEVHDAEEYQKYLSGFMDAFNPFGGRILVATDKMEILEGRWPQVRTIVMGFSSLALAKEWCNKAFYYLAREPSCNLLLARNYSS